MSGGADAPSGPHRRYALIIKTSYVKGRTESMLLNMSATLPRPTPVCFGKTYDARSRSRQGVGLRPAARP